MMIPITAHKRHAKSAQTLENPKRISRAVVQSPNRSTRYRAHSLTDWDKTVRRTLHTQVFFHKIILENLSELKSKIFLSANHKHIARVKRENIRPKNRFEHDTDGYGLCAYTERRLRKNVGRQGEVI